MRDISAKVLSRDAMKAERSRLRNEGRKVVFTNGCFDILHAGHLNCLIAARKLGDVLIVGMNSDNSIRRYKPTFLTPFA